MTSAPSAPATIRPLVLSDALGSLLPALPAAAMSAQPSEAALDLLSPILRQRVQFLSSTASSGDPWIRLLCYDSDRASRLQEVCSDGGRFEPHPVSGEIEVDWDYDAETQYRRLDPETLQALVVLADMGLAFRLVYCSGEANGWRVGEVTIPNSPSPFSSFNGASTIAEAERQYKEYAQNNTPSTVSANEKPTTTTTTATAVPVSGGLTVNGGSSRPLEAEDDDDDYWARYDASPTRTPAQKRSPAPGSSAAGTRQSAAVEEDYYAQYDSVQPAMDGYDPDEDMGAPDMSPPAPPLGLSAATTSPPKSHTNGMNGNTTEGDVNTTNGNHDNTNQGAYGIAASKTTASHPTNGDIVQPHPRPPSSASSRSVERLEAAAEQQTNSEFGVRQHVSRSVKSLWMLSRASGIDREEFNRIVQTELDMLDMMED